MRETAHSFLRTDTVREEAGKLNALQVFVHEVKAQRLPDPETEAQAAQCIAQGVDGLRDTLLRLPTTWALILAAVKQKRRKTLFEASSCLPLPPLEPIRFLLHSLSTDWTHATDGQARDLLSTRAVEVLSPLPFTRRFIFKAAEVVGHAISQGCADFSANERCAVLAAMRRQQHHIDQGVNRLVESHLRVALAKAERYRRFGLHDAEILDLVQESSLGLIRAARNYDPQKGRFQTYAMYWIQQAIGRYLLKRGHLVTPPSQILQASRKVARTGRELEASWERAPTPEEIAQAAGLSVEMVREAQEASAWCVSLETPIGEEDLTLGDLLVDDQIVGFDEDD